MPAKHPIDIIYKEASDAQKVWVEAVNKYYRKGGIKFLKKSLDLQISAGERITRSILEKLPKKPKVVVDIGAGYGGIAISFAKRGIQVFVVEPDLAARRVIKFFLAKHRIEKQYLQIIEGSAEKLQLKKNSADLCVLSQVLEHVADTDKTLSEVSRVLKLGGYCHLSSPNYLFPAEQHYHLPYFPLMSKKAFKRWAIFLLRTFNTSQIKNVRYRDFSKVKNFIDEINYTTDRNILKLCKKNKLTVVWSASEQQKDLFAQIKQHWSQDPSLKKLFPVSISVPIKIYRSVLAQFGILPMKLEYLFKKEQ